MKELSIEERAIRYDEAIERYKAKQEYESQKVHEFIEYLFPELKESEDERIRKEILAFINRKKSLGSVNPEELGKSNTWIAWLEKQGAQKPIDKVKPKFKVGDWISGYYTNYKVLSVNNKGYIVEDTDGNKINILFENEKFHHLFTIVDAKGGDVLACPNDAGDRDVVFIFKSINIDEGWVFCFCAFDANGCFCTNNDYVGNSNSTNISTATKEQRETLERVMTNAGYRWDKEKLKLEKI